MGSFNVTGFQTKLPICYGDDVFALIGVIKPDYCKQDYFSPGHYFTPITLPIFGVYNDYGCIESIRPDKNTELISSITGFPIEKVIEILDNHTVGRVDEDDDYEVVLNSLLMYLIRRKDYFTNFDPKRDYIGFIMDHKFFYDECVKVNEISWDEFNEMKKYSESLVEEDKKNKELIESLISKHSDDLSKESLDTLCRMKVEMIDIGERDHKNINPNFKQGNFYRFNEYFFSQFLMCLYTGKNSNLLFTSPGLEDEYRKFLSFFECFERFSWKFSDHNYCSQDDGTEKLLPIYESMVNHIKQVIEDRK